ncbi:extracellular solute-binding protein [Pelagibacterium sp. 26DY04]|uniref:extracellular solute-binding protein n=1 Tax=Pelagibacterium sp. 26DY04 TaxID=2967130 RepID=UPI002815D547|nr:extracellular solute-binding protein [Pelagibacterium sp. 26DY04]WMT85893.1 extracellular solute-binding protein [Pelagibacterium sp. 26DY04]
MTITLKGMTWDHPRGYDPLVACSDLYCARTGVEVQWEKRSLQDFESYPVEELARAYDLIVIDHPHVGQVVGENCLAPLDVPERSEELDALADASVGPSFPSYAWQGRLWALPVDAASQVQAYRPDRVDGPATDLDSVMDLAREGRVLLPLKAPHALMTFYSLAANMGVPCAAGDGFIARDDGISVYETLAQLVSYINPVNFDLDPIDALERLARADSRESLSPYVFGYVNYAQDGFRDTPVRFADVPAVNGAGPRGAVIGGTGMAVSAYCQNRDAAIDFAFWITSAEVQAGPYAQAGGQPGHRKAWESEAVNAPVRGFFRDTLKTLDQSYLRPRFDGYMPFQDAASRRLSVALANGESAGAVIDALCALYDDFAKEHLS